MRYLRKGLAIVIALSMVLSLFVFNFAVSANTMSFNVEAVGSANLAELEPGDEITLTLNSAGFAGATSLIFEFAIPAGFTLTDIAGDNFIPRATSNGAPVPLAEATLIGFWDADLLGLFPITIPDPLGVFTFEVADAAPEGAATFGWSFANAETPGGSVDLVADDAVAPSTPITVAPSDDGDEHIFFFIRPSADESPRRPGYDAFPAGEAEIREGGTRVLTPGGLYEALVFVIGPNMGIRQLIGIFDITDETISVDVNGTAEDQPLIEIVAFYQTDDFNDSDWVAFHTNMWGAGNPLRYQARQQVGHTGGHTAPEGHVDFINEAGRFAVALEQEPEMVIGNVAIWPVVPLVLTDEPFHVSTLTFRVHEDARDGEDIPLFSATNEAAGFSPHFDAMRPMGMGTDALVIQSWFSYVGTNAFGVPHPFARLFNIDSVHYVDIDDAWEIEIDQDPTPEWILNDRTGATTFELVADVDGPVTAGEIVTWSVVPNPAHPNLEDYFEFENADSDIGDEYVVVEVTLTNDEFYGWVEFTVIRQRYEDDDEYVRTILTTWVEIAYVEIYNEAGVSVVDNEDSPTQLSVGQTYEFEAEVRRDEYTPDWVVWCDVEEDWVPAPGAGEAQDRTHSWVVSIWDSTLEEWVAADPADYDLDDDDFTPNRVGRFRLTAISNDEDRADIDELEGLLAHTFVNVVGRLNLEGRAVLTGKFMFDVGDWDWGVMEGISNYGILVELINRDDNNAVVYSTTSELYGYWEMEGVPVDADLLEAIEDGYVVLRVSRHGTVDRDGTGDRAEAYMDAVFTLNATGENWTFATNETRVVPGFTVLHPGAFMNLPTARTTVTSLDVSVIRALVGLPGTGDFEIFNISERFGINIHDFNSVVLSQGVLVNRGNLVTNGVVTP